MIPTDYTCTNAFKFLKILTYHKMDLFYNLILQSLSNKHRHLIKLMQDSWLSNKHSNNQNIILLVLPWWYSGTGLEFALWQGTRSHVPQLRFCMLQRRSKILCAATKTQHSQTNHIYIYLYLYIYTHTHTHTHICMRAC